MYMDVAKFQEACLALEADDHALHQARIAGQIRFTHAVLGLASEVGELIDPLKKHGFAKAALDKVNVLEECCDILWYLVLALDSQGYTLEQAMNTLLPKLEARHAKKKFSAEASANRNLEAERSILEAHATGNQSQIEMGSGETSN